MTDPITDMLNRIKTAGAVGKTVTLIPFSKAKFAIANILAKEGFLASVQKTQKQKKLFIKIGVAYNKETPKVEGVKRVSKPGQRIYQGWQELKKVKDGYGISIISTSKGLMTNKEARKNKMGGEVLLEIW